MSTIPSTVRVLKKPLKLGWIEIRLEFRPAGIRLGLIGRRRSPRRPEGYTAHEELLQGSCPGAKSTG